MYAIYEPKMTDLKNSCLQSISKIQIKLGMKMALAFSNRIHLNSEKNYWSHKSPRHNLIYKPPSLSLSYFTSNYLNLLLHISSVMTVKGQKPCNLHPLTGNHFPGCVCIIA